MPRRFDELIRINTFKWRDARRYCRLKINANNRIIIKTLTILRFSLGTRAALEIHSAVHLLKIKDREL